MKKAVSLLISLVILLSAFTAIPVHAEGETHKVIIHSAQGLFEDAYADFSSGDIFNVGVNLKSDCQLSQGQFVVKYDPDVFIVSQNFTTDFNFPDPVVNLQNGEFTMVFDSVNQLVNTLSGGNFITFKVKALSTFTSDQTFTFDFQLLEGGRYKTDTDSFGDPRTYIDPSFAKLYIEKSQVKLPGLKVAPHFNEEESVENDEPGTMTATLSNTGYSFGNENWYAYTWTDDGSKWRWIQLGDDNVATGLHENVIFCRVDKNASSPSFDYVWNQTEDLKTKDGGTFTITSWNEGAYGNLSGYWDESDSTFATTVTDAAATSAPSTAAPSTAAPSTAAPTGTDPAETTAATTAQNQTTDSNINRITVTSTQGLFEDVSENFAANNNFELTIKLKTSYPLSQGTVSMKFDPTQLTVYDRYTSPYTLPDDLVNVTDKGEFVLLFSSITTLVDTTNGGTFFTIRGKTNDAFTGDQKIEVNFDTLIGGRYVTEYDPVFQEYNTYIDKDFDYTYTEFSEVRNHELEVEAVLTNLSGAPATSPTQAPTQTDPTESATPAPTTVAPITVAPTTAAPTTAAPTTAAPTTAAPTGAAGTHKVTVKSPQGIFSDASAYVTPGEMFTIRIELKTEFPLSDATFAATYDPNQVLVGAYSTSLKMPTPTTNRLNGEYRFVLGTGAELVDTTNGGEFVTLKVKAQSAMDSDQIININFETLRSGRYNTVYDEWNEEYVQIVDPTFEQLYIAFNEVKNTDFDMKVYINWTGEQPTTAAPTTVAPTTVAPTTVAPTTVAPTTVAPTTAAPTTVAPTTATSTSGDGSYKITVKSPQGIFTEASARIMPGEMFTIRIELKTEFPLSDATFAATYDPNQVLVGAYSTSLKMPTPTTNRLNGEYRFVLGTGAELVDTTNGGEFVTLKAKALDTMNSDQIINLDFETLRSGRYNTVYDEWNQEYVQIVDPTFEQLYIAFDEVKNTDFDMKVYINWTGEQPTTAAPTTVAPTTVAPTTVAPTTVAPTTVAPTTVAPTTVAPTTVAPTTVAPTTVAPTTVAPTTVAPTTVAPTTVAPTTVAPTTVAPTTIAPTTVAPTTVAPTTLAPTTVAPTTVAPTTVAPTTLAPTTVAPTTAAPTPSPDGKYQLTVRSAQNMFTPFSKRFEPGEEFAIGIKINTSRPIKGYNLTALFDQTQVSVDSYATTKQMTPFTSKYSGKYNFVVGSAGELIDPSGEFIMLRGKCLNEFNTNQEIILDFTYLIVGNLQDPDYEQYFVADGVMLSHDFSVRAYFTEYVEPQPTTAEPTTLAPTTAEPTTLAPTTAEPTTFKPTETVTEPTETATQTEPISTQPETETSTVTEATEATTAQPTEATTAGPVVPTDATEAPSTAEPTTQPTEATTAQPTESTTAGPVVPTDATEAPSTAEPTTQPTEATTALPTEATTAEPTTEIPTTAEPTTQPTEATTAEPSTEATTAEPTTEAPTTQPETTTPATQAPTQAPTKAPATQPTTAKKIDNLDGNPNSDSAVDYVKNLKNDKDPKGSTFGLLRANSKKVTKNSIKITWKKLKGAKKYIIMGNKCGKSYKKITTTTKLSFTQKKLRKGTYYKYMILAVNAKNKVIAVSKTLHVATKGGKIGNYKSVKITNAKSTLTLKKGKKMKLKAKAIKADKKVRNHRKIKFESSKPSVVKITAGGKLTAKKKGTAIIYAYAQNGVFKKIKVKVK